MARHFGCDSEAKQSSTECNQAVNALASKKPERNWRNLSAVEIAAENPSVREYIKNKDEELERLYRLLNGLAKDIKTFL